MGYYREVYRDQVRSSLNELINLEVSLGSVYTSLVDNGFSGTQITLFKNHLQINNTNVLAISFTDGLIILATDALLAINSNPAELIRSSDPTQSYSDSRIGFLRFIENCYGEIMEKSFGAQVAFFNLYISKVNDLHLFVILSFVFEILVYYSISFCLVRMLFRIESTNRYIISLFSMIGKEEIAKLRKRCSEFFANHLSEYYVDFGLDFEKLDLEKPVDQDLADEVAENEFDRVDISARRKIEKMNKNERKNRKMT